RNREQLYERLKRAFAGNATVRVVLDRRVTERRERSGPYAGERRQGDRRSPLMIDEVLRAIGWVVVPQDVPKRHRGSPHDRRQRRRGASDLFEPGHLKLPSGVDNSPVA